MQEIRRGFLGIVSFEELVWYGNSLINFRFGSYASQKYDSQEE